MKIFIQIILVVTILIFVISTSPDSKSSVSEIPCCNNIDPNTLNEPLWGLKCGGSQFPHKIISRSCCFEKWWFYGPYPPSSIPCPCETEEGPENEE